MRNEEGLKEKVIMNQLMLTNKKRQLKIMQHKEERGFGEYNTHKT